MNKTDTQESRNIGTGHLTTPGATGAESVNVIVEPQQNVNSESATSGIMNYTVPVNLGYDTLYKTRLTGKLKVAQIVQDIVVVMVCKLVSYPDSYVDIFVTYLHAVAASGICISGIIFILHSCGVTHLYLKSYKNVCTGFEFLYCLLWLAQFLVIPSLILGFTLSIEDYDETVYTESYKKNLIFILVIAYLSTIVYAWDVWATFKVWRKQLKKPDASVMLNPTSSIAS